MNAVQYAECFVGDLSARLQQVQDADDLDGLAGVLATCAAVHERVTAQLAGRVTPEAIEAVKTEVKTAQGW